MPPTKKKARPRKRTTSSMMEEAREFHALRPKRARDTDEALPTTRMFYPEDLNEYKLKRWKKNPNRFDIYGID